MIILHRCAEPPLHKGAFLEQSHFAYVGAGITRPRRDTDRRVAALHAITPYKGMKKRRIESMRRFFKWAAYAAGSAVTASSTSWTVSVTAPVSPAALAARVAQKEQTSEWCPSTAS